MRKLRIAVANRQNRTPCDCRALKSILAATLRGAVRSAEVSVAVVTDDEIAVVNRRFLGRDRPTDVIAFPYCLEDGRLEGEIVINAEEALRRSEGTTHTAQDELMLYAVHGMLHLLGHDDATRADRKRMNGRALDILRAAGRNIDPAMLLED